MRRKTLPVSAVSYLSVARGFCAETRLRHQVHLQCPHWMTRDPSDVNWSGYG